MAHAMPILSRARDAFEYTVSQLCSILACARDTVTVDVDMEKEKAEAAAVARLGARARDPRECWAHAKAFFCFQKNMSSTPPWHDQDRFLQRLEVNHRRVAMMACARDAVIRPLKTLVREKEVTEAFPLSLFRKMLCSRGPIHHKP